MMGKGVMKPKGVDEDAWPEARQPKTMNASAPVGTRDEVVFESSTRNCLHKRLHKRR